MLTFKINEIPEGKSLDHLKLTQADLDLSPYVFIGGDISVNFEKYTGLIRVHFEVASEVLLICDRSLEQFPQPIKAAYSVLFDANAKEVSEDALTTTKPLDVPGNIISIHDEVRDTILLKVPFKKLHPRFLDVNGEETDFEFITVLNTESNEEVIDPRWEKLKSLKTTTN